ncbi:MAG: O-antigen ligase family protein [Candidatus Muiribacteriota bacterium]
MLYFTFSFGIFIFFSHYKIHSLTSYSYFLVGISAFFLANISGFQINRQKIFKALYYSGILPVLFSIIAFIITGSNFGSSNLISTFGNQNWFATYLCLILTFYILMPPTIFNKITALFYMIFIYFSGSRAAFIALFILLFCYTVNVIMKSKKRKKTIFVLFVFVFLLVFILYLVYNPNVKRISSVYYRAYLSIISMNILSDLPNLITGCGFGSFPLVAHDYQYSLLKNNPDNEFFYKNHQNISHNHNDYLQVLTEGGILVFLFFLFLFYALWKKSLPLFSSYHSYFLLVLSIIMLVDFPLRLYTHTFLIFIFALDLLNYKNKNLYELNLKFRRKKIIYGLSIIILILALLRFVFTPLIAVYYTHEADDLIINQPHNFEKIRSTLALAVRSSFYDAEPNLKLMNLHAVNGNADRVLFMKKRLQNVTNSHRYWFSSGQAYEKTGQYKKAVESFEKSLLMSRGFYLPYDQIVKIYLQRDKPEKAVEFLEKYIFHTPKTNYYLQLAELHFQINNKKESKEWFKYIVENIDNLSAEDNYNKIALKTAFIRLYQLTENKEYLEKSRLIKQKSYAEEDLN